MVEPAVGKYLAHTHPGIYLVNARYPLGSWIVHALARKNTIQRYDQHTEWHCKYAAHLQHDFRFQVPSGALIN